MRNMASWLPRREGSEEVTVAKSFGSVASPPRAPAPGHRAGGGLRPSKGNAASLELQDPFPKSWKAIALFHTCKWYRGCFAP